MPDLKETFEVGNDSYNQVYFDYLEILNLQNLLLKYYKFHF